MAGLTAKEFDELWERYDAEGGQHRLSNHAAAMLGRLYDLLDEPDREVADGCLVAWLGSINTRQQEDALDLVGRKCVRSALPWVEMMLGAMPVDLDSATASDDQEYLIKVVKNLREPNS